MIIVFLIVSKMNRIIELPNTEISTKHIYLLPEGKYWFGDLLCVMDIHTE